MATELIEVKFGTAVRPNYIAYFVPDSDLPLLCHLMRYCCTQWGGMRNLIIPIGEDLAIYSFFQEILLAHPPDTFVSYLPETLKVGGNQSPLVQAIQGLYPYRQITLHSGKAYEARDSFAHPLSVLPDRIAGLGSLPADLPPVTLQVACHKFASTGANELACLLSLFGEIWPGQEGDYNSRCSLRTDEVILEDAGHLWPLQFDDRVNGSILNLTTHNLHPRKVEGPGNDIVFDVIVGSNPFQLCAFWSYRAVRDSVDFYHKGRRTVLFPDCMLQSQASLLSLLSFIRTAPAIANSSTSCDVIFHCYDSDATAAFMAMLEQVRCAERAEGVIRTRHWGGKSEPSRQDDHQRNVTYAIDQWNLPAAFEIGARNEPLPRKTTMSTGRVDVVLSPPDGFKNRLGQSVIVDFVSDLWDRFPKSHLVANMIISHSWFSPRGLSAAISLNERESTFQFHIPDELAALKKHFQGLGYQIRLSDKGRYANGVLSLIGGLPAVLEFASPEAYEALQNLALRSSLKVAQRLARLFSGANTEDIAKVLVDVDVVPEWKRVPKTADQIAEKLLLSRSKALDLLGKLSQMRLVRRGIHIDCPSCATPGWYSVEAIAEDMQCAGCLEPFHLPVEYPSGSGSEPKWEYTLNTLINRAIDQDVLPVLIAVHHAVGQEKWHCLQPGLELIKAGSNDVAVEFDFVFVRGQSLIGGEVKAGTEVGDKDMKTARHAADLGLKCFWFCSIAGFSDESMQTINQLVEKFRDDGVQCEIRVANRQDMLKTNRGA